MAGLLAREVGSIGCEVTLKAPPPLGALATGVSRSAHVGNGAQADIVETTVYRLSMNLSRKEILWLFAVIAVAAIFSSLLRTQTPLGEDVSRNSLALAVRQDQTSPVEGSSAADVTLIVFADYRCPACRAAQSAMKRAVAKDGKVRVVYKDWPIFGPASERAAEVAIASDFQHIYPLVHDRLMTGRVDGDVALRAAVEFSGGDWRQLQRDLARNKTVIDAQLGRIRLQAFQLGLGGTPGYLIGPILVRGAMSEREFTRIFKQAREAT